MTNRPLSYDRALDFIMRRELFGIKLGLDNISRFLNKNGRPQDRFKAIHIAGTNGKGSTATFIESILRQSGYRTGIFTSPHLADYRERIRVNGERIRKDYIIDFVKKYRHKISRNKITFFETCTALAFNYFADCEVDIAIVEVGLGGRLDATTTLNPIVTIITDISYDHTSILGNTLKKIAYEKAGIVKTGIPMLTGVLPKEASDEIKRICKMRKAPFEFLRVQNYSRNGKPFVFDYRDNGVILDNVKSSLMGNHQIKNAALAIRAAYRLNDLGFKVTEGDIRKGLENNVWAGRFQVLKKAGGPTLVLDVGHNPSGVKAMVDCFREVFPGRRADLVLGFVRGKDLEKSVEHLNKITRRAEVVMLNTHRTADPFEIKKYFDKNKDVNISVSVVNSVRRLLYTASPDDIIIICGSHYAVGEFIEKQKLVA